MNRRQKIIVSITGIFIVLLALVGLTYAYFLTQITGNGNPKSISVTTANLELVYGDGNVHILEPNTSIIPSSTPIGTKDFTVTNNGEDTSYTVLIEDTITKYASSGSYKDEDGNVVTYEKDQKTEFVTNDFQYTLTCKKYNKTEYQTNPETATSTGACDGISNQKMFPINGGVITSNNILSTEIHVYELKFWYIDTGLNQSKDMNKTYNAKIDIVDIKNENPYSTDTESLAYNIINNSLLKTNGTELMNKPLTTPVVEASSEYEKVLSVTQDNLGTSYYYRGSVQDNYVLFNNICWRIVRIEGDGSVKLTLAGGVSEGATDCSEVTYKSGLLLDEEGRNPYFHYGYEVVNEIVMADYNDNEPGILKYELENWFEEKFTRNGELTSAGNKLKEDEWCLGGNRDYRYDNYGRLLLPSEYYEESEEYGKIINGDYSAGYRFNKLKTTDLTCGMGEDEFTSRIGTLTVDEVSLAGSNSNNSATNYLYENGNFEEYMTEYGEDDYIGYWLLSYSGICMNSNLECAFMISDSILSNYVVETGGLSIRPTVTLIPNTKITKGNGLIDSPYVIE